MAAAAVSHNSDPLVGLSSYELFDFAGMQSYIH